MGDAAQPELDANLERYEDVLNALADLRPHVALALSRAHANRVEGLRDCGRGRRIHGLEELLGYLGRAQGALEALPQLSKLAFLVERAKADYEMAIEATLSGMNSVVFEAMRDVMEIEYLFTDFAAEPLHIEEWLSADRRTQLRRFSPEALRRRQAERLGVATDDLSTATDYRGHSTFLHVNPIPNPFGDKGILNARRPFEFDSCFWDMYLHGSGIVTAILVLIQGVGGELGEELNPITTLSEFTEVWVHLRQVQGMFWDAVTADGDSADSGVPPS